MSAGTKASELRELGDEELLAKLREAKEELFNLRFQAATGQLENHGRLKSVRKDIARIYTLMHDAQYRMQVSGEQTAYNQPPHPSFHIGSGMAAPPAPNIQIR